MLPQAPPASPVNDKQRDSAATAPGLTDEQLEQFKRDGYLVLPAVFDDQEVRRMRTEADHILEMMINATFANRRKSGRIDWRKQPDGPQVVRKVQPINDLSLYLTRVSEDSRLIAPLRGIMNDEPRLMEEKLNYKQPLPDSLQGVEMPEKADAFPVHNDWAYYKAQNYPQTVLSSAISMDECTEDNGPLRVWPGSHRRHLEHQKCDNGLEVKPDLIDHAGGQSVLAPAGSVMLFHTLLVHNSKPNVSGKPRRLMIYSHFPSSAGMPDDERNRHKRLRESPWEWQYLRMKLAGDFEDVFHAPVVPGHENAGRFWIRGDRE